MVKVKVEENTVKVYSFLLAVSIIFLGATLFGLFPFELRMGYLHATVLGLAGVTIVSEIKYGRGGFEIKNQGEGIAMLLAVFCFIMALAFAGMAELPPMITAYSAVAGLLFGFYIMVAATVVFAFYTD